MRIKVKTPDTLVALTLEDVTLQQFLDSITQLDSKRRPVAELVVGFPPKKVDLSSNDLLLQVGISNGDMVKVSFGNVPDIPYVLLLANKSFLVLRNIPDDNSCMFSAVLAGLGHDTRLEVGQLRKVVADHITANPDTYSEVVLGQKPSGYCQWIISKDAWGGAIELQILAQWLRISINCVDVELGNIITFDAPGATVEMYLCYSGVHYDSIVENSRITMDKQNDVVQWPIGTVEVASACKRLAVSLQSNNYATNTTKFRVRCLECHKVLVGETGAQKHAEETNHVRFGEVK